MSCVKLWAAAGCASWVRSHSLIFGAFLHRAEITRTLLKLASAPEHHGTARRSEAATRGVAERTFRAEAQSRLDARQRLARKWRRSQARGDNGGEEERLDALRERLVLQDGAKASGRSGFVPTAGSRKEPAKASGKDGVDSQGKVRYAWGGREPAERAGHVSLRGAKARRERDDRWEAERAPQRARDEWHRRFWSDSLSSRAAAGFARASKLAAENPYKKAMTGSVFEHFLHHPNPRALAAPRPDLARPRGSGREHDPSAINIDDVGAHFAGLTHASEASSAGMAGGGGGVRMREAGGGKRVPSGYTGFAGF